MSQEDITNQFVNQVYEDVNTKKIKKLMLEIDSIDNINVYVKLEFDLKFNKCCWLTIESSDIYCHSGEGDFKNLFHKNITNKIETKVDYMNLFNEVIKILKSIKFNKLTGKFEEKKTLSFCEAFPCVMQIENIKTILHDCSVCYEKTFVKTPCNHSLCIECWSKVKKVSVDEEDADIKEQPCPICRHNLEDESVE